jgi:mono/diheme cytochrome c family protein
MANDADPNVIQQLLLTFRLRQQETHQVAAAIAKRFATNELITATAKVNLNPAFSQIQALSEQYKLRGGEVATQVINGFRIFQDNCAACHGADGKGTAATGTTACWFATIEGRSGTGDSHFAARANWAT